MISVKAEYINLPNKHGTDYFIYTDVEVIGHSEHTGSYTHNIRLCAGISACCYGIRRLINDEQYNVECKSGYYHIWTERTKNLRVALDKTSVHAIDTLVCQLFELYNAYPTSFSSFELVDVKEKIENEEKRNQTNTTKTTRRKKNRMGIYSLIKGSYLQEN